MAAPTNPLDPLLCFAVYSLERKLGRIYRELLAPWGLSYTQYLALVTLWAHEGEPLSVGELGARLDLDTGTMSPLLRRLETRGLISRGRLANDERVVVVALTPEGDALREELADVQQCLRERLPMQPEDAIELRDRARALNDLLPSATAA